MQHGSSITSRLLEDAQHRLKFHFKLSTKEPSLGNILIINGCFNCVTSCIQALRWLKKKKKTNEEEEEEEEEKEEEEQEKKKKKKKEGKKEDEQFLISTALGSPP